MAEGPPTAPAFNPNTMGGMGGGQPAGAGKGLFGISDTQGLGQYDTQGFLGGKIGGMQLISSKNTGWKGHLESGLGIRTKVKMEGFEGIQHAAVDTTTDTSGGGNTGNATYDQVYGSGQVILQHGGEMRGFSPHEDLGQMAAPATPGMGKGKGGLGI
ncbi:MAG: hypothetical protein FJX23_08020 [Alphaproteobacteria bacterium]|nr:hypothetical protein [Alphaproteobacteria bacterium]